MIKPLVVNAAVLVNSFGPRVTAVYIRVFGPGNVRLGSNKEKLEHGDFSDSGLFDGMPQIQGDQTKEYFIAGDLYAITDQNATYLNVWAPQFESYEQRGIGAPPLV